MWRILHFLLMSLGKFSYLTLVHVFCSSPAVLDFKCNLPSVKRGCLPTSMRQQFIEVNQNKALILHDTLEALDR